MVPKDTEKAHKKPEARIDEFASSEQSILKPGLYVVATPIGNLRDISLRALDVLRSVDLILCEDTRVTRKLLFAYQVRARAQSYNDHSSPARREEIRDMVAGGRSVALVSDAGMPLISDPGYKLVCDLRDADIYVTSLPGASAPLAALQLSGLPSDAFSFIGFLPNKTGARQKKLRQWSEVPSTLLAFETSPRLIASLRDIGAVFGNREVAVVREITKMFEEMRKGTPLDLAVYYEENGRPKGEIVLVIAPPEEGSGDLSEEAVFDMIRDALNDMKTKDAASFVADKVGLPKKALYDMALKISREGSDGKE